MNNENTLESIVSDEVRDNRSLALDVFWQWLESQDLSRLENSIESIQDQLREVLPEFATDQEFQAVISMELDRLQLGSSPSREISRYIGPALIDGNGRYQILSKISAGSQGAVYRAIDRRFGSKNRTVVAVKVFREVTDHESVRAPSVDHPNVVPTLDIDVDHQNDPLPYIVYKYLDGPSLDLWMTEHTPSTKGIIRILMQICKGVQAIHCEGLLHRDIKPANIIMVGDRPVIVDFGLAVDGLDEQPIAGSPHFMAPEQISRVSDTTHVDIYAIGAVAYFLLTGESPNGETLAEALVFLSSGKTNNCSAIDHPSLRAIVRKCLSHHPSSRYDTAASVVDDLQRILDFEPAKSESHGILRSLKLWSRRNLTAFSVGALITILMISWSGHTYWKNKKLEKQNDRYARNERFMKRALTTQIASARLNTGYNNPDHWVYDPARIFTMAELTDDVDGWEPWSYRELVEADGYNKFANFVYETVKDPEVSRITAGYWWLLLAHLEANANYPVKTFTESFENALIEFSRELDDDDPLILQVRKEMQHEIDNAFEGPIMMHMFD